MRGNKGLRSIAALFFAGALIAGAACSDDDDEATAGTTEQPSDDSSDTTMAGDSAMPASSAEACDASQITAMVQSGAEQGTLLYMTGGERAVHEELLPVMMAMGAKAIYCGTMGQGATMKLIGNHFISLMLEAQHLVGRIVLRFERAL